MQRKNRQIKSSCFTRGTRYPSANVKFLSRSTRSFAGFASHFAQRARRHRRYHASNTPHGGGGGWGEGAADTSDTLGGQMIQPEMSLLFIIAFPVFIMFYRQLFISGEFGHCINYSEECPRSSETKLQSWPKFFGTLNKIPPRDKDF